MHANLRKVLDMVNLYEAKGEAGVLISLDFEKVFDKVEYGAVEQVMRWFNFGENMVKWVRVLFKEFYLQTINNGYISDRFMAQKGLLQGNPAAPYLFIMVIEVLATKMRQHNDIKGLKLLNERLLLTLFADDVGIFLRLEQREWNATVEVLEDFCSISGMSINYDKTVVYRLGSVRNTNARFYTKRKMIWLDEPVKMLGIYITESEEELIHLNYA